jgi:hypothetical protein
MSDYIQWAVNAPVSGSAGVRSPASGGSVGSSGAPALSDAELAALRGEGSNSDAWDDGLVFPDRSPSVCQSLECESAAAKMELAAAAAGPGEEHDLSLEAPLEAQRLPERRRVPTQVDALLARLLGG